MRCQHVIVSDAAPPLLIAGIHPSKRIDRQLIGRAGRQGGPGSYRLILWMEDDLLDQAFSSEEAAKLRAASAGKFSSAARINQRFTWLARLGHVLKLFPRFSGQRGNRSGKYELGSRCAISATKFQEEPFLKLCASI